LSNNNKKYSEDDIDLPIDDGDPSLDDEGLDEEEEGEEGEQEEEVEGILDYVDDSPREVDLSKLTKDQRKDLELNFSRLLFLKALSIDCYQDFIKLGRKVGFKKDVMSSELVQMAMAMITQEHDKPDYPAKILRYFNRLLPDNYPRKDDVTLDEYDINELANLFKVHEDMAQGLAVTVDPDKLYGENVLDNLEKAKEINQAMQQQKAVVTTMDVNYQQSGGQNPQQQGGSPPPSPQVDNGQGFIPQAPRNNKEFFLAKYDNQDIGLMEYALRSIFNPRPNFVPGFINNFIDLYSNWINNPAKIQEQLIYSFGDKAGSQAYLLWRDLREDLKRNVGGGGSLYSSSNRGMGMSFTGDMDADYQRELMAERRQEKRMKQLMDMMQMKFMETAMQAQTPTLGGAMGGNFEEVLDHNGKVIKRIFMNNNNGGGNSAAEGGMVAALSGIFNTMMQGANQEKIELLKKVSSPDTTWQTLAQTMLNQHFTQQNPASLAGQLIEVANVLRPNTGNNDITKSLEATKLEVDTKIALKELDLKEAELKHNWHMDERQSQEQDSNVDKWLTMLQSVSTDLIKPVALKFVEGFGKGAAGNPLGAMFGQPQQPPQQGPSEQEIAEAQQRYYMQQQQAQQQEPPLEPMGPPPRSRYNPAQPPGMQQRPPPQQQQRGAPLDEQQLQQQLQQMQPDQLEELHDQLEMEDMKRERAKNMIKAVMNAKRSRPMTAERTPPSQPQQQQVYDEDTIRKAQETLNFDNTNEEEDEDYNPEDDYEVPIAAGQSREKRERKRNSVNTYGDKEFDTSELNQKRLNRQERALLAQGEISPEDIEGIEDQDAEDEEDNAVPIAGVYNESDEAKKKKTRTKTVTKKKEEIKDEDSNEVIAEAEDLIEQVEEIPSDDLGDP
jgi:hypothetical protein